MPTRDGIRFDTKAAWARRWRAFAHPTGEPDLADLRRHRLAERRVRIRVEMEAVDLARFHHLARLEETDAQPLRDRTVIARRGLRFFIGAGEQVGVQGDLLQERGRRHDDDFGHAFVAAGARLLHELDQNADSLGDLPCRFAEALLEVVGAEHDRHDVERLVAHQAGIEVGAAVLFDPLDRIVVDGRAAAEPLLDHQPAGAERRAENARPALIRPIAPVRPVDGRGAERIGIAVAENGSDHDAPGRGMERRRS